MLSAVQTCWTITVGLEDNVGVGEGIGVGVDVGVGEGAGVGVGVGIDVGVGEGAGVDNCSCCIVGEGAGNEGVTVIFADRAGVRTRAVAIPPAEPTNATKAINIRISNFELRPALVFEAAPPVRCHRK